MTNSEQGENEVQPTPEVEDSITNPGKRDVAAESSPAYSDSSESGPVVSKPGSNKGLDRKFLVIAGVFIVLIALFIMISGGSEEGENQNASQPVNNEQPQGTDDALAETDNADIDSEIGEGAVAEGGDNSPSLETAPTTNAEGLVREDRVLDSIQLDTDIAISSNEELIEEITDMLVLNDRLGPNDTLSISTEGEVNGNRIIRMQQTHLGVPVFGAEVVAVEVNGNVFNISGSTGNDIEINIDPELSFEQALEIANQALTMTVSPRAEPAQLLIVDIDGTYHLAWYSIAIIAGAQERIFLDAQEGAVLMRLPINIGEA